MISIGDALLKVGIDTRDIDKGLQGLGDRIKQHQKAIGLGMVAAGGAILAAGALSIKTFAEMGDEVQKMAIKTGFSTEALSELRHAAEISGTSLEGIEKGVKRMASTLLDAEMGLSTSVDALNELGLSVEDFKGLSPEEAFIKFMEAIADVEDPLKRSALAQDIFGKSGVDLLPIMESGSQGLAALRQEAHALGIVFDQEAANKAAEMTDAMKRMDEATSGLKMVIAGELIPVLMPLIEKVKDIISGMSAWMKEHPGLTKVIVLGTGALGLLLVALGSLLLMLPMLVAGVGMFTAVCSPWLLIIGALILAIGALGYAAYQLYKNWDEAKKGMLGVLNTIRDYFVDTWNSILGYLNQIWVNIATIFQGIANAMWEPIKNAIQWIIDYINTLVATIQRLFGMFGGRRGGVGVEPEPGKSYTWTEEGGYKEAGPGEGYKPEYFQHGGIAMRPMIARIGEQAPRIPEAVIPLDRLEGMLRGSGREVHFHSHVYVDGREVAEAVVGPLGNMVLQRSQMEGR